MRLAHVLQNLSAMARAAGSFKATIASAGIAKKLLHIRFKCPGSRVLRYVFEFLVAILFE